MSGIEKSTIRTDAAVVAADRQWLRTGFDLHIQTPGGQKRLPLCYSHMTIGCEADGDKRSDIVVEEPGIAARQALLKLIQGQIFFNNTRPSFPIRVNGEVATFRQLKDQDELQLGQTTIRIVRLKDTVAFLEGYSAPYEQMSWRLGSESVTVGRPGSRQNTVSVDHPSVSREHATIVCRHGVYALQPENEATWVNAEKVRGIRVLKDEDLIQVGQQLLRFRVYKAMLRPRALSPKDATILFSDIWDYTRLAETRPLEETIDQLNQIYRALGKVIMSEDGILMTYLGDAMMAVFGAEGDDEEHAPKAVRAALKMIRTLGELNERWSQEGLPALRIGIGISTGEVMVGDVGVTGHREFAAMGDTTNLASRIEKLTRDFGSNILITASTEEIVRGKFKLKDLGAVEIRGRRSRVEVYEVLSES
ncbi:MAG: FHA domain-containing protein [Armatimonadetes bacterium]|nr:FHA domain-containing protein [Armatimonadota bacterium]